MQQLLRPWERNTLVFCFKDSKYYFIKVKSQQGEALCSEISFPELLCTTCTVQKRHKRRQKLSADESLRSCSRELESKNDNQAPQFLFFITYVLDYLKGCGIEMNHPWLVKMSISPTFSKVFLLKVGIKVYLQAVFVDIYSITQINPQC